MNRTIAHKSEITARQWKSWTELYIDYKNSLEKVNKYRDSIKSKEDKDIVDKVNLEITASMKSDLKEMTKEIEQRILYELNAYNDEDFNKLNLTERQREVLMLRSKSNSYTKIAEILGIKPSTAFEIYVSSIKKIIKQKEKENQNCLELLSPQLLRVYFLKKKGRTRREIANELNISFNTVKSYLKEIKDKLKGGGKNTLIK